ncbi:hypothetical protein [Corynebacterium doosanense]|uniref:Bacteriocin biosynthesis cyclodehydratase domain-containing protein n=1 Tax=Corynebacterium doosanense CAU 212 = DSM 45436 TaxID=558173 RepID=A0A097IJD1_9CORY|nr:hypothetical protein [Corynebacterium doosanense]AIT62225.1 hypothetical protein CDOO_03790 [Corynebacterium doosanense CAU 212 = DSM 45436]
MTPVDPLIMLNPSAQVLLRGDRAIQFGLDASRAGIVEVPDAPAIARCLAVLEQPTRIDDLLTALAAAGLDDVLARCLVDELLGFGIARPVRRLEVLVVGRSRLALELTRLLRSLGVAVRIPVGDEGIEEVIPGISPARPVVLVDQFGWTARAAGLVASTGNPVLSVTALDSRGLVGPVRPGGRKAGGPCPLCVELHWVRQDGPFIVVAGEASPLRQDPVAVAATAASAASMVLSLLAARPAAVVDGECLLIDPHCPDRAQRFSLAAHPGCPACFELGVAGVRAA